MEGGPTVLRGSWFTLRVMLVGTHSPGTGTQARRVEGLESEKEQSTGNPLWEKITTYAT